VRGIRLAPGDKVVEADAINDAKTSRVLVVMENGLGKMTPVTEYRFQGRGGSGVKAAQLTSKTGDIVGGCILQEGDEGDLLCLSKQGQAIRMKLSDIPSRGRATQGVIVMRLKSRDKVATMSVVMEDREGEEAVQEAAEDVREEEVEVILKEERRVKRAALMGKKASGVAVKTDKKVSAKKKVTKVVAKDMAKKVAKKPAKPAPKPKAKPKAIKKAAPKKKPAKKPAKKAQPKKTVKKRKK